MKRPTFAVHKLGLGNLHPVFTGSLSACLDFIRHYMRDGAAGYTITREG